MQTYAERLITLAEQAYSNQNQQAQRVAETQLVGYFIDGLYYDHLKMKVLRVNPPTLDEAVNRALYEQNLRKRLNLRSGREYKSMDSNDQPIDVGHKWPSTRCQRCNRLNHRTQDCRAVIRPQVNAVNTQQSPDQDIENSPRYPDRRFKKMRSNATKTRRHKALLDSWVSQTFKKKLYK